MIFKKNYMERNSDKHLSLRTTGNNFTVEKNIKERKPSLIKIRTEEKSTGNT